MNKLYPGIILVLIFTNLFWVSDAFAEEYPEVNLEEIRVINIELIEKESINDITIRKLTFVPSELNIPPQSKKLIKLTLKEGRKFESLAGIVIKGYIAIEDVFRIDSAGHLSSISKPVRNYFRTPLLLNQVCYEAPEEQNELYLLLNNKYDFNINAREIVPVSYELLNFDLYSVFINEIIITSFLTFLLIIFSVITIVFKSKKFLFYSLGLLSMLIYSVYIYGFDFNDSLYNLFLRSFSFCLYFNYLFVYEHYKRYLKPSQAKKFRIGLNLLLAFGLISVLSVVLNFWYFFSAELFFWIITILTSSVYFLSIWKQINQRDRLLLYITLLFNLTMILLLTRYFNPVTFYYMGLFLLGTIFKEVALCVYFTKQIAYLKESNRRKFKLIKQLKRSVNEEKGSNETLQFELQNTEEKIVQNSVMVQNKEKLILELEKLLKSKLDRLNLALVKPILNEIQSIEKQIGFKQFDYHFQRVNQELFDVLQEKFPQLTLNDRRLCVFIRMNLNSKEIAAISGKSPGSVDVSRHRLRKKLGIETNSELQMILASVFKES